MPLINFCKKIDKKIKIFKIKRYYYDKISYHELNMIYIIKIYHFITNNIH